jgi:transcriptional regulator PpsR
LFANLPTVQIASLIERTSDVSLLVDEQDRVVDLVFGSEELREEVGDAWQGRRWLDTVSPDSREKLSGLLEKTRTQQGSVFCTDLDQRVADGTDAPLRFCAVALDADGSLAALGRDLSSVAALQQQVLNAQQALEQDYWKLRQIESRYRLLFQMSAEAVLVLDNETGRVLEANPVAGRLLGGGRKSIAGATFPVGFDREGGAAVEALLTETRAVGRASVSGIRTADSGEEVTVSANLLRQEDGARLLVRVVPLQGESELLEKDKTRLSELLRQAPDAVLLTDVDGRIEAANLAFVTLAQLPSEEQAIGRSVDRWLGRTGVDLNVLLTNLRQREVVRLFATTLRSEFGTPTEVEISASQFSDPDRQPKLAFFIRDIGRRVAGEDRQITKLPKSVAELTQQVGRVPLKDLVRRSTDLIERLCIEAALELTSGNRASAAELLGLSRQGLYTKLHRYKLGDGRGEG